MGWKYRNDISFSTAAVFLKLAGIWFAANRIEKWFRRIMFAYNVSGIMFCTWVQTRGLFFSWGDLGVTTYIACNILSIVLVSLKLSMLFVHEKKWLRLIAFMQKNFWHSDYDQHESLIIANTRQTCIYFVCFFSFCTHATIFNYIMRPVLSNIGKNESDRALMFNMFLDLPLSMSPYFEIMFTIQVLALLTIGICYVCLDNIFCIICLHVAGQFRVLQYRLAKTPGRIDKGKDDNDLTTIRSDQYYPMLNNYIEHHKSLIEFCSTLEEICKVVILGQVLMFSILTCFVGYQMLLMAISLPWRITFAFFLMSNMIQLWMFTYSCDCVMRESQNVSSAVYEGPWIHLPMDKFGKTIRKDLRMVAMRSRRACCLTACGFFPISLETYTKIMSTTLSYFTILKQSTVDTVDNNY